MKYKYQFGMEMERLIKKASQSSTLLHDLLFDLLTPAEYKDLAVRWQIIKQLQQKVPQREISKKLKVGIATVTRGSNELRNKKGGFRRMLESR